jgi:type II secretory pathway component PulM
MSDPGATLALTFFAAGVISCGVLIWWLLHRLAGWADRRAQARRDLRQARRLLDRLEELGLDVDEFLEIEELEHLYASS